MPKSKLNGHFHWLIIEKILEGVPHKRIAEQLNISKPSVSRIFSCFKKYGCVDLSSLGGRSRILSVDDIKYLENLLKEKIDWYIWELQSEMELWLGRRISYSTLWRAIHHLGYTHKQLSKPARERNENDRLNFIVHMSQYSPLQLVFSDESAYNRRTLSRRYGWSFKGRHAYKSVFFVRGKRYTIEGALCLNGLLAYAIQEGPMNSNDYSDFIENVLLPKMNAYPGPYSVLVLDNVSIHKGQHLLNICNAKGVRVEYLPPYSPDINPIEQAFFYIKNHLRQNRSWIESMQHPIQGLDLAYMTINKNLSKACFEHSGYM
ncbi:unnamed protein product [Rhizophagus irregularis]|uniref:Tc1-like transposase DDE domain-containing protein n=1 Tax=Rhizophagus irregularis TaxID=588596 RepID=A0A916A1N4_9GLOM|nr:unnamed protein product [Rhizophagus irregularis]CAB5211493.1 unnamed protein product [Rhizophagus irregularis]CAB5396104.1 unnamed protein product [Rhizophagus irregularis]